MGCGSSKSAGDAQPARKKGKKKKQKLKANPHDDVPLPTNTAAGDEAGLNIAKIEEGLPPEDYEPPPLVACPVCERMFAEDRIRKHKKACKIANKGRKTFDSKKMRQEREAAKAEAASDFDDSILEENKGKWREQHEDFIRTVRQAKAGSASASPSSSARRGGGGGRAPRSRPSNRRR